MGFFNPNPADKFLSFLRSNCCWVKKNLRMCEIYLKHPLYRSHTLAFSWLESTTRDIVAQYKKDKTALMAEYEKNKAALQATDNVAKTALDREYSKNTDELDESKDILLKHIIFTLHAHVENNSTKVAFTQKINRKEKNKCSLAKTLLVLLIGEEGNRINRTTLDEDLFEICKNNLEGYIQAEKSRSETESSSYVYLHKM